MMPLPIIVFLESHIDCITPHHYENLVRHLITKGYNKFCLEAPSLLTIDEIKSYLSAEISDVEELLPKVVGLINSGYKTTNPNSTYTCTVDGLLNLEFTSLIKILQMYVSSQKYSELALKLRSHIPNKVTLRMFNKLSAKIDMVGIDTERTFSVMDHAQYNKPREDFMFNKLLELYNNGCNIIFKVGKLHGFGLYQRFLKEQCLDNIVFIDLLSPDTIASPYPMEQVEFMNNPEKVHKIFFESIKTTPKQLLQLDKFITTAYKPMLPIFDNVTVQQMGDTKATEDQEEVSVGTLTKNLARMKS